LDGKPDYNFADHTFVPPLPFYRPNGYSAGLMAISPAGMIGPTILTLIPPNRDHTAVPWTGRTDITLKLFRKHINSLTTL